MRRVLFAIAAVLALSSGVLLAWSGRSGMPFAWRGSLTGQLWGDLLTGSLPRPRCVDLPWALPTAPPDSFPAPPRRLALRDRLRPNATFTCGATLPGRRYTVTFVGHGGGVTEYTQTWSPRSPNGPRVRDSVMAALTQRYGPPVRCRSLAAASDTPAQEHLAWRTGTLARDLILSYWPPPRDTLPYGWQIYLQTAYKRLPCASGA